MKIKHRPNNDCLSSMARCFAPEDIIHTVAATGGGANVDLYSTLGIYVGHGLTIRAADVDLVVYFSSSVITALPANSMVIPANTTVEVRQQFRYMWIESSTGDATVAYLRQGVGYTTSESIVSSGGGSAVVLYSEHGESIKSSGGFDATGNVEILTAVTLGASVITGKFGDTIQGVGSGSTYYSSAAKIGFDASDFVGNWAIEVWSQISDTSHDDIAIQLVFSSGQKIELRYDSNKPTATIVTSAGTITLQSLAVPPASTWALWRLVHNATTHKLYWYYNNVKQAAGDWNSTTAPFSAISYLYTIWHPVGRIFDEHGIMNALPVGYGGLDGTDGWTLPVAARTP